MDSGGETSKAKDSRAVSSQACKGTKRQPEKGRPDDIDQCLMNLIIEDRDRYLQSIEGESEPVCEEKIPLPPELEDEQPHGITMMISVGKFWAPKVLRKQEEM